MLTSSRFTPVCLRALLLAGLSLGATACGTGDEPRRDAVTGAVASDGAVADTGAVANTGVPASTGDVAGTASSTPLAPTAVTPDGTGGTSTSSSATGTSTVTPDGTANAGAGGAPVPPEPPVSEVKTTAGNCTVGAGQQQGQGQTQEQYLGADVTRDGRNYRMITNGWGMNWQSHDISWLGTTLSINNYQGSRQDNGAPAGYPTVFCGRYSDTSQDCGLPMQLSSITAMNTAVSWSHAMNDGTYNVAYDVWLGDGQGGGFQALQSYFMVWLKDPADESPAGSLMEEGVTVPNAPGVWNIIAGEVNGLPIVNYVRAEGDELHTMAFDIMDFIRDGQARNLDFPGNDVLAVAIGFEIWQGPVTGLQLDDFCLDLQ
jgi:Glycosyl hydrolase family 12